MAAFRTNVRDHMCETIHGKHPLISYESQRWPGCMLELQLATKSRQPGHSYSYRCKGCYKIYKQNQGAGRVPTIKVILEGGDDLIRNGIICQDSDFPANPHFCNIQTVEEAVGRQTVRLASKDVRGVTEPTKHLIKQCHFVIYRSMLLLYY